MAALKYLNWSNFPSHCLQVVLMFHLPNSRQLPPHVGGAQPSQMPPPQRGDLTPTRADLLPENFHPKYCLLFLQFMSSFCLRFVNFLSAFQPFFSIMSTFCPFFSQVHFIHFLPTFILLSAYSMSP